MSNSSDSNVIQIDFNAKRVLKKEQGTESFSSLIERILDTPENKNDWPEDLSPKERSEQLKKDLEFLQKMNKLPAD